MPTHIPKSTIAASLCCLLLIAAVVVGYDRYVAIQAEVSAKREQLTDKERKLSKLKTLAADEASRAYLDGNYGRTQRLLQGVSAIVELPDDAKSMLANATKAKELKRGESALLSGMYETAIGSFETVVKADPFHQTARAKLIQAKTMKALSSLDLPESYGRASLPSQVQRETNSSRNPFLLNYLPGDRLVEMHATQGDVTATHFMYLSPADSNNVTVEVLAMLCRDAGTATNLELRLKEKYKGTSRTLTVLSRGRSFLLTISGKPTHSSAITNIATLLKTDLDAQGLGLGPIWRSDLR